MKSRRVIEPAKLVAKHYLETPQDVADFLSTLKQNLEDALPRTNASRSAESHPSMNRNKIKAYAPQARRDFIRAVTDRAALYGLTKEKTEPVVERGDVAVIGGRPYPRAVAALRKRLKERVDHEGFDHVMEAMAYTWFNRLVAIRYMELHGYLDHGFRVLSHPEGRNTPEILEHAEEVDLPGLRRETVIDLKLAGNREPSFTASS